MAVHQDAPIPRTYIDAGLPFARAALGLLFVAYSAQSTILFLAADLMWLFPGLRVSSTGVWADAYWVSIGFAVLLFAGEVFTAERYPRLYRAFLAPDSFYTARGIHAGLATAFAILISTWAGTTPEAGQTIAGLGVKPFVLIGWLAAWPPALLIGIYIARWGEVLLFGKRRKIKGAVVLKEKAE